VLGICGGLQMLGEALIDLHGVDGNAAGLGLLPVTTLFAQEKTVQRTEVRLPALPAPWQALEGMAASVYEIHHGQTAPHTAMQAAGQTVVEAVPGLLWHSPDGVVRLLLAWPVREPGRAAGAVGHGRTVAGDRVCAHGRRGGALVQAVE
jgi:adenosylcobyric acid synthase